MALFFNYFFRRNSKTTDFLLAAEEIPECILVKKVEKKDFPFIVIDGIIVHENALDRLDDIKNFIDKKGKTLTISKLD